MTSSKILAKTATDNVVNLLAFDAEKGRAHQGKHIIGVDEVGLGSLAGPVVAAAVCLPANDHALRVALRGLNDSKKLSAKQREYLSPKIKEAAIYSIGMASVEEINSLSTDRAALLAMTRAVQALLDDMGETNAIILVDGPDLLPHCPAGDQTAIIKGDSQSACIAAASVIAKVHRDRLMFDFAKLYPGYSWERNSGYATVDHTKAIAQIGLSPIHRASFECLDKFLETSRSESAESSLLY